jgi:hypothetical protein
MDRSAPSRLTGAVAATDVRLAALTSQSSADECRCSSRRYRNDKYDQCVPVYLFVVNHAPIYYISAIYNLQEEERYMYCGQHVLEWACVVLSSEYIECGCTVNYQHQAKLNIVDALKSSVYTDLTMVNPIAIVFFQNEAAQYYLSATGPA